MAITKIKEKSTAFPVSDIGYDEGTVSISMPLDIAIGSAAINPTATTIDTESRIAVRKRLWRFMSRTADLTTNNLKISYDINGDNKLRAAADPTSKIGVSILHRDIKVVNRKSFSLFDAYVDLVFDYSEARLAGQYTGFLTINVDCSL